MTATYKKAEQDAKDVFAHAESISNGPDAKARVKEIEALLAQVFEDAHTAERLRTDIWAHFSTSPDVGHMNAVTHLDDHIFKKAHQMLQRNKIAYNPEWIHGKR
ncbi:hypothetical protein FGG08_000509 [Glutinoglossum americanum]|uniref:Uncharacterized protein n=1 Tax=Glutinoglossum americanum TaxID=1670608 RepID=A0A9P8L152_9PEZI|nr:hypothetical protein FGG08_000509 [Glutinoglossum americanum]